jgi:hypothetical protein
VKGQELAREPSSETGVRRRKVVRSEREGGRDFLPRESSETPPCINLAVLERDAVQPTRAAGAVRS